MKKNVMNMKLEMLNRKLNNIKVVTESSLFMFLSKDEQNRLFNEQDRIKEEILNLK